MQELPEKNTHQSQPEDDPSIEETTPAAEQTGEAPSAQTSENEAAPEDTSSGQPAEGEPPAPAAVQPDQSGANGGAEGALGSEEAPVPAPEAAAPEAPTADPAAETAAPAAAQLDAPEETEEASPPNLDELTVTSSGAVALPGEEAPRSEEPRPKRAPAKPEKPTGPRISDLRPGQVVDGTVTRIEKYGAFVNLGLVDRRDGLIHISEMSAHRIRRVEDVVQVGDSVRARVVSVDLGRGRIALSLNDVDAETAKEASVGPTEPTLTSMELAFREAQNRQRERDARGGGASGGEGKVGERKRREQEELMRRLQEGQ